MPSASSFKSVKGLLNKLRDEVCPSSPKKKGKHEFNTTGCQGSWHHNDQGGPIYSHQSHRCKHCDMAVCDFTDAKKVGQGWY
ncbi:MAG: hypothetical protein AAB420_02510 [Patescibacteria group bacterium]